MPRPATEHEALALLAGEWLGQETIHPSPFDPIGGPAVGHVHNRPALNGFAIVQDYEQERNGAINFRGHGVFRWDADESCYILHWFDSLGQRPVEYRGTMEAGILTLSAPQGDGATRAIFDFSREGRYRYRMEVSPDGEQWFVFTEAEYQLW